LCARLSAQVLNLPENQEQSSGPARARGSRQGNIDHQGSLRRITRPWVTDPRESETCVGDGRPRIRQFPKRSCSTTTGWRRRRSRHEVKNMKIKNLIICALIVLISGTITYSYAFVIVHDPQHTLE